MKIIDLYTGLATAVTEDTVVALGFFDGVHAGHRELLLRTVKEAEKRGLLALVLTFSEEGSAMLKGNKKRIFTEEQRLSAFKEIGVRYALLLNFMRVKDMTKEDFVSEIVIGECNARVAVCGFNFRYGRGAEGNAQTLSDGMARLGRECIVCEPYTYGQLPISSTRIKDAVEKGDMQSAHEMLGHNFYIEGEVYHGKALARSLGVPTANFVYPQSFIIARHGVYATVVELDGVRYNAVTNIGIRPTVDDGEFVNCETHIIDYEGDLYGKSIRVELCRFLREECRFDSIDDLKAQIEKDRKEAVKWLNAIGQN